MVIRVAFVWPNGFEARYLLPLSIAYLKANLPDRFSDIHIIDCSLQGEAVDSSWFRARLREIEPEVVCVSTWSAVFPQALEAMRISKQELEGVTTIFGGPHATSNWQDVVCFDQIDYVLTGEAEFTLPKLLDFLDTGQGELSGIDGLAFRKDGQVVRVPAKILDDIDTIRRPDFDFIGLERYWERGYRLQASHRRNAPLWVTRGCPYRCSFCSAPLLNGKPVRTHSLEYMRAWILELYHGHGVRWFNIVDDNFTFNTAYAKDFCRMVIEMNLDIGFGTPNGIRVQRGDMELWRLMKAAGWRRLIIAPESGSERSLKRMRKDLDLAIIPPAVREIQRAGLHAHGLFLIGYPGDTVEDLHLTRDFIKCCGFDFFYLNVFQPLPGTPIFDELVRAGEIQLRHLPNGYSEGTRSYVTPGLRGVNLPAFVLSAYFSLAISRPHMILHIFCIYDFRFLWRKLKLNIISLFSQTAKIPIAENEVNPVRMA